MKLLGRPMNEENTGTTHGVLVELTNDEWQAVRELFGPMPFTVTADAIQQLNMVKYSIREAAKAFGMRVDDREKL